MGQTKRRKPLLYRIFRAAAIGTALGGAGVLALQSPAAQNALLQRQYTQNIDDICIRVADRLPPHAAHGTTVALNAEQKALAGLLDKMDETPIGQELNKSAASRNVIWCVGYDTSNYGQYVGDLTRHASITMENFGGAENILGDRATFNRALRTAYEENAHAWQGNSQHTLFPHIMARPHHQIAWNVAIEGAARVTAYSALQQHRAQGDIAAWRDNYVQYKNNIMMKAMDRALAKNPDIASNLDAQWAAFDAFYDFRELVSNYQYSDHEAIVYARVRGQIAPETFARMGQIPGGAGNYMAGRAFNPDNGRYGGLRDESLRDQYQQVYRQAKLDPAPLDPAYRIPTAKTPAPAV